VDINRQDETGRTALHFAVTYDHVEILQTLLRDRKLDVDLADNEGRTPVSYAAAMGYSEMVKLLLANGPAEPLMQ
jgi:ankyrin repeat domain-containing protein 50